MESHVGYASRPHVDVGGVELCFFVLEILRPNHCHARDEHDAGMVLEQGGNSSEDGLDLILRDDGDDHIEGVKLVEHQLALV